MAATASPATLPGHFTFELAEQHARVIYADLDQSYLDFIIKTSRSLGMEARVATRLVADDSPRLEEQEVDGVLLVDTCHHMDNSIEYFRKLHRNLKEDGESMILEYLSHMCTGDLPPVELRVPSDTMVEELREVGFTRFEVNRQLPDYQYVLIAET